VEQSELSDLLPLYVTGKVSDAQKAAIEDALLHSKELQDELAFWRRARGATKHAALDTAEAHLRSEQIVDYARGVITNPMDGLEIQRHLQACDSCREDYEIMKPALAGKGSREAPVLTSRRFTELLAIMRPAYSVPAIAVLLVCAFLFRDRLIGPHEYPMSFVLQYQSQERSVESNSPPTLSLAARVSIVRLSVPIPRAAIQPERYSLTLLPPDGRRISLVDRLTWSRGTSDFDTASVSVAVPQLQQEGTYTLLASIEYARASRVFEYSYLFKLEFVE
jgi:hypothetical protein